MITGKGFLSLPITEPDIGNWKHPSLKEVLDAMGGGSYHGRRELIDKLQKVTASTQSVPTVTQLIIPQTAEIIVTLQRNQGGMTKMLTELNEASRAAQKLLAVQGIGVITAAAAVAEIIDIRRFAIEGNLATYSGPGMAEHSTGEIM